MYCVDNIMDSVNQDAFDVAKEALTLNVPEDSQSTQNADPPLQRKASKPMPGVSRPGSRNMEEERK